jgi:hypothetical protein
VLFSDDAIIVIEAKAQQGFDEEQLETFSRDSAQIAVETGVGRVVLMGLCSSKHTPSTSAAECFEGRILTWADLARFFGDDPQLRRADDIYELSAFSSFGLNNTGGHMTGAELLAAYGQGGALLC